MEEIGSCLLVAVLGDLLIRAGFDDSLFGDSDSSLERAFAVQSMRGLDVVRWDGVELVRAEQRDQTNFESEQIFCWIL
jgi:hypothetical protein